MQMIETTRRGMILADVRGARGGLTLVGVAFSPLVMAAQAALIAAGYSVGVEGADGKLGPHTIAAIKKYQADHGLPVTGKVDDALMASLGGTAGATGAAGAAAAAKVATTSAAATSAVADATRTATIVGLVVVVVAGLAVWLISRKAA